MHVGCLGRPLRPTRWPSRRTKWCNLIRASEPSAALIAVLVASDVGFDHLRRWLSGAEHYRVGRGSGGTPTADSTSPEERSQRSTVYGYPKVGIAPSAIGLAQRVAET